MHNNSSNPGHCFARVYLKMYGSEINKEEKHQSDGWMGKYDVQYRNKDNN